MLSPFAATGFVLVLLLLGVFLRWTKSAPDTTPASANALILHAMLPASVLLHAPKLQLSRALLSLALLPWLLLVAAVGYVLVVSRALGLSRSETGALLLCVPLGNTAFLGYPMVQSLLGNAALPPAVAYDQLGSFLALSTYGLTVLALYGGATPPTPRVLAAKILRFPPFLVLLAALFVVPANLPPSVTVSLEKLAAAQLPVAAIPMGMQLSLRPPKGQGLALLLGLLGKLVLTPMLALALAPLLGLQGEALRAVVLQSAMPSMITAALLAGSVGLAPELASGMAAWGIVGSLASLPLWAWIVCR